MAPAAFISSRTACSTLRSTRRPSGDQVYRPAASLRIMPALSISLWLTISASAGVSLLVWRWNCDRRIGGGFFEGRPAFCHRIAARPPDRGRRAHAHAPGPSLGRAGGEGAVAPRELLQVRQGIAAIAVDLDAVLG